MARHEYDLELRRYNGRGWRAVFFPSGFEHSLTSHAGAAWARSPWKAVQRAARTSCHAWPNNVDKTLSRTNIGPNTSEPDGTNFVAPPRNSIGPDRFSWQGATKFRGPGLISSTVFAPVFLVAFGYSCVIAQDIALLQRGAFDYIAKPVNLARLQSVIAAAAATAPRN
jgi:hypothetical protein